MVDFRVVISDPTTGNTVQKVLSDDEASKLYGLKIGSTFRGEIIGLPGFELEITGGSDSDGFPMRSDLHIRARKRLLLSKGIGYRAKEEGMRKRKSVRGSIISEDIAQLNTKVTKGKGDIKQIVKGEATGKQESA